MPQPRFRELILVRVDHFTLMTFLSNMMFGTTRGGFWLPFVFFFWANLAGFGQVNISGKKGLMFIPSAEPMPDGTFQLQAAYLPSSQSFFLRDRYSNTNYNASLQVLPRVGVQFLINRVNAPTSQVRQGLGDRQVDFTLLLVKETNVLPYVSVIATFPFAIFPPMSMGAIVATKNISAGDLGIQTTVGWDSPWVMYRDEDNSNNARFFSSFTIRKKEKGERGGQFLYGPFAGLKVGYRQRAGFMAEWTGQQFHVGAYATVAKRLTLQGGRLSAGAWMASIAYQTPLVKKK